MRSLALLALVLGLVSATASASPVVASGSRAVSLEQQLLRELNAVRVARGRRPLRLAAGLQTAAVGHSEAMLRGGFFDHASKDGTPMADRVRRSYPPRAGAWSVGENLIWASPHLGAKRAIASWLGSPGHRLNMLSDAWREVGIGALRATRAGGVFGNRAIVVVTMDFGAR